MPGPDQVFLQAPALAILLPRGIGSCCCQISRFSCYPSVRVLLSISSMSCQKSIAFVGGTPLICTPRHRDFSICDAHVSQVRHSHGSGQLRIFKLLSKIMDLPLLQLASTRAKQGNAPNDRYYSYTRNQRSRREMPVNIQ
jgi:hypothetical protein